MTALARTWDSGRQISLMEQLVNLRRGTGDPTFAATTDGAVWRTTLTPDGPGLERLEVTRSSELGVTVLARAWGPGAPWLLDRLPRLLGQLDDPAGFTAPDPLVETSRRHAAWRVGRTERVLEALVPAILEQKVTGKEAWHSWRYLVRKFGEPAPSVPGAPPGLAVFPKPEVWRTIPSWDWHRAGVDGQRSATVLRAVGVARQLEGCRLVDAESAHARLRSVPGIGVWTAAETAQRALGDADAVSYADYHLAHDVVFALTSATDGTDQRMAELLEAYAGHRYRVQRLVEFSGIKRPRRGPRMTIHDLRGV